MILKFCFGTFSTEKNGFKPKQISTLESHIFYIFQMGYLIIFLQKNGMFLIFSNLQKDSFQIVAFLHIFQRG